MDREAAGPDAPYELDAATASRRQDDGTFLVELTSDWNTPNRTPNGGYVLAVLVAAVRQVASLPDVLSASTTYLKPPSAGPATVTVEKVREGRVVATYEARLVQDGAELVRSVVSLHDADRPVPEAAQATYAHHGAPDVPGPDDCLDLVSDLPTDAVPILGRYDVRHPARPGWADGSPSGVPEALVWIRPRDGRPIDDLAALAIVDGHPPATVEMGLWASATVQLTVYLRRRPATDWVLMHVVTRHVGGGFHEEDVELWDTEGRLVAQGRQLAILS